MSNGAGQFVARWFVYGRLEQPTRSPKDVNDLRGRQDRWGGSGYNMSHTIDVDTPLPFA